MRLRSLGSPLPAVHQTGTATQGIHSNLHSNEKYIMIVEYLIVIGVAVMMGSYTLIIRQCLKDA